MTSSTLNVLVMRDEKCLKVILQKKFETERCLWVNLTEYFKRQQLHKRMNVLRWLSTETEAHLADRSGQSRDVDILILKIHHN